MTFAAPRWPKPRPGYVLTRIAFRPDGSCKDWVWEKVGRRRPVEKPAEAPRVRRGVVQKSLFD